MSSPIGHRRVFALAAGALFAAMLGAPVGATAQPSAGGVAAIFSVPARTAEATPVEPTGATIKPSFSPDRLGAKAAFTFMVHFTGGELGVPSPVRKAVVQLPPGLMMDIPRLGICTKARLQARGASGCPKRSLIGTGHALADVHAGEGVENEEAKVWAFLGPPQGLNPTIEILGQGYTPLEERVVVTATAIPDRPPYGEELVMSIPAIPSIPYEPNASTVSFTLTVGGARFRKHSPNTVQLPSHCPAGGFPFATEFTYEDGSTSNSTATVPCP